MGDERPVGASYVRLPTALPPDETEANWLTAEGMLGLVWGGGKWFAKGAEGIAGVGGAASVGVKRRRGMVSKEKGTAYMRGPRRWRWPDVVVADGTEYLADGAVELLYGSAEGKVLNMTG